MALTYEQIQAAAKKKGISQANVDKFAGLKWVSKPASSSGISTIKNPNTPKQNTNVNAFGDVSGANNALKNKGTGVVTANKGLQMKPEEFVYWEAAKQKEASGAGYLQKRNDTLAQDFYNKGIKDSAGVQAELSKNAAFTSATPEEQANTVQGILNRMGGMTATTPEVPEAPVVPENAGKYTDAEGNLVDILGYGDLPDDVKQLVDGMTDADKKMLDMQRGNDVNGKLEYLRQAKRTQEYNKEQRGRTVQIRDINWDILEIQASQRLQDAGKQLDNLIQNVGYLGSRWQPWQSSIRLQAANKMVADAQQRFAQLQDLEQKYQQARELGDEFDTAAYEKQMADISDDLNMKVGMQIQNAMNEMTAADLSGQLDTIDWVTQFRRELFEKLDANISGYTEGSMKQMQYVTEQYDKLAQEAQTRLTEWTKNANTVNMDMSKAKGVYTDWNGNPLYNADWTTISMPEVPPMEPVYDKESGQLITFSNDENGQIVAKVQQVTNQASLNQQAANSIAQLVVNGTMSMDNVPAEMRASVAIAMATMKPTTDSGYQWPEIAPVSTQEVQRWLTKYETKPIGSVWGECGSFVNDYLNSIWIEGRLFVDPIDIRKTQTNSDAPTPWSIAVFEYPPDANVSDAAKKYGHVAIVTKVNADWSFETKESNKNWDKKVFSRTMPAGSAVGFFDPSKWLKPQATEWASIDTSKLSSLAKAAYNSKSITSSGKSWDKVVAELQDAWAFDIWEGNLNYYKATQTVKNEIPNVVEWYTEWKKAYDIIKNLESTGKLNSIVWPFDAKKVQAWLKTWIWYGEEVSQLNTILQKTLSQYMMKISGATVPDAEVARLQQQVPNLSQGETQFLASVELYNTAMNSAIDNVQTKFGFSSPEKVKEVVYGKKWNTSSNQTTTTTSNRWDIFN